LWLPTGAPDVETLVGKGNRDPIERLALTDFDWFTVGCRGHVSALATQRREPAQRLPRLTAWRPARVAMMKNASSRELAEMD